MKENIMVFLSTSVIAFSSFGQDCTQATLLQKNGTWKEGIKGSVSGIPAQDLAQEKNITAALHAMIKSKYAPVGVRADFTSAFHTRETARPGNAYSYSIYPLNYFCDSGVVKTADETSTYFSINVNYLDAEIYDAAQGDRALAEGFNVMPDMPVKKAGYFLFKEKDVSLGFGVSGKRSMWLITNNGELPWSYVTKREFLEKRKQILAVQMLQESSGFRDILKNKEIEKGYKETEYKNDPVKLERYMRMDYQSTKDRYEKLVADNEKNYKPAFSKIESLLKAPASVLGETAIVKKDPDDHLSYLFTDDDDPNGQILIKSNPAYFNKKLPRSSPQFFSVVMIGDDKDPVAAKAMADIMKAVDFTTLKNMLGK